MCVCVCVCVCLIFFKHFPSQRKFWAKMGFVDEKRKWLYPEEALYLMEIVSFTLFFYIFLHKIKVSPLVKVKGKNIF